MQMQPMLNKEFWPNVLSAFYGLDDYLEAIIVSKSCPYLRIHHFQSLAQFISNLFVFFFITLRHIFDFASACVLRPGVFIFVRLR
ncbi:unnamed protein product [Linum tenue]|uniref:Uncharacterized protein n=1 Tax=Linum tenue TaxID=586396 RepID=A0AAV0J424_9ROSI|nr:unnamed protein product [Linum tenue]